eukprot:3479738-Rhodomonas_salina.1
MGAVGSHLLLVGSLLLTLVPLLAKSIQQLPNLKLAIGIETRHSMDGSGSIGPPQERLDFERYAAYTQQNRRPADSPERDWKRGSHALQE